MFAALGVSLIWDGLVLLISGALVLGWLKSCYKFLDEIIKLLNPRMFFEQLSGSLKCDL